MWQQHNVQPIHLPAQPWFSLHELVFLRKPPNFLVVDFNAFPDTCIQYHEYVDLLKS